jgi:hypothetical protein
MLFEGGLVLMLVLLNRVLHQLSTQEQILHIGAADGAPGFEQLVDDIAADFGMVGVQSVQEDMHDWNGDWDILYPFSAVSKIASYRPCLAVLFNQKHVLLAAHFPNLVYVTIQDTTSLRSQIRFPFRLR